MFSTIIGLSYPLFRSSNLCAIAWIIYINYHWTTHLFLSFCAFILLLGKIALHEPLSWEELEEKIMSFSFLVAPSTLQDLSFPTRDRTHVPCSGSMEYFFWAASIRRSSLRRMGFSLVMALGFSCPMACGILVSGPGVESMSPTPEGQFLITEPPGKPLSFFFLTWINFRLTEKLQR